MMEWYHGSHINGDQWATMSLMMGLLWVGFMVAAVLIFRCSDGWKLHTPRPRPMEILNARFARGEMDSDEYKTRRAALRD